MTTLALSDLAICGIEELPEHSRRGFTHVLTLIDPDWPEITAFETFDAHERKILRCHDVIDPIPGTTPPDRELVQDVVAFGESLAARVQDGDKVRLLVHCHMGVSRSSAAMLSFLAQTHRDEPVSSLYDRLRTIRPKAWPNSVMVGYIDEHLRFDGALVEGLRTHYGHRLRAHPRTGEWMAANGRAREVEMALLPD
ncbi:MAG: tyrosine phosphatase family protein [Rhodospirillales bacterium]